MGYEDDERCIDCGHVKDFCGCTHNCTYESDLESGGVDR